LLPGGGRLQKWGIICFASLTAGYSAELTEYQHYLFAAAVEMIISSEMIH
jgi:hypothetical protein